MRRDTAGAAAAWAALLLLALPAQAEPDGRALYNTKCALCHGREGKPNPALAHAKVRAFADADWQKSRTDADLRKTIEDGKPGTLMRSFKKDLSSEEIAALVRHVRSFAPPPADK